MEVSCAKCGKPVRVKPSNLRPTGNYCSKTCFYSSGAPRPGRKTGTEKTCEVCGVIFYCAKAHSAAKFCGRACKGRASQRPRTCAACGEQFIRGGTGKYCSKTCAGRGKANGETHPCAVCGTATYIPTCRLGKPAYFCSPEHANEWQGRNKTSHTCKMCGKTFRWSPSREKTNHITYCSIPCRNADPEQIERLRQMNVSQQQGKTTRPEQIGYSLLSEVGVAYHPQHLLAGKFCVDAFLPDARLVVQFDGDYWHGNPDFFSYPDARQQRRMRLDTSQDAYLRKCGFSVLRIWESDLKRSRETVKAQLLSALARAGHTPAAPVSDRRAA